MEKLTIRQLIYEFQCDEPLSLHYDLPTITIRGAFGYALAQVIADQTPILELNEQLRLFQAIFAPKNPNAADGFDQDQTRPFVLRGHFSRPDRRAFQVEAFLFGVAADCEPLFDLVFDTMAQLGLGKYGQPCTLAKLSSRPVTMPDLEPKPFLTVTFRTPCARLKFHGSVFRDELPFAPLAARLIDRLEELNRLYGDAIPFNDFADIGDLKRRATQIPWKRLSGGCYHINRVSGRTGNYLKMDGFLGTMEYQGDFAPFLPYLRYLPYIHLGRFNVFGCGSCDLAFSDTEI